MMNVLALAQFVPDIIGLLNPKRGKKAKAAMETVANVAEALTGKKGDDAIAAIAADPNLALEFKLAVMADSHVEEQLEAEDRASARDSYKVHHEQADRVAQAVMSWNLLMIFMLVVINVVAVYVLKGEGEIIAIISGAIGIVTGQLLNERHSITSFFFGSSLGSKMKTHASMPKDQP